MIGLAVEPKTQKDLDKLGIALAKLAEEDPTFTVRTDEESGQTDHQRYGRASPRYHRRPSASRVRRGDQPRRSAGNYKEALTATVQHREVFKKQTGGRGKFADIIFEIGPADDGKPASRSWTRLRAVTFPRSSSPRFRRASSRLWPTALWRLHHRFDEGDSEGRFVPPVDSDQLSFEICARNGFRQAAPKAGSVIMEPIMSVEVVTPEENMGDIIGDLNKRRGQIQGMESKGTARVVKAKVPLSEMFGYVTVLRTISSGRATSSMEFSHFEEVPATWPRISSRSSGKRKDLE